MEPCLLTTVMGAFPKPDSVPVSDWFDLSDRDYTARWADEMEAAGDEAKALFARAATEVAARLTEALRHIDRERLVAAPDCGLGYLGRDLPVQQLRILTEAASRV